MKNAEILIGIDPDVHKSGFACLNRVTQNLELRTFSFPDLQELLRDWERKEDTVVIIEAGWLNKPANFRRANKPVVVRERMASKTGRNEQIGRLLMQYCERYGLSFRLVRPRSAKTTPELFEKLTKIKTRNQEKIDAAMLVIGY